MYKLRAVALAAVAAATLLFALVAAGAARADGEGPRANVCDVEKIWGGPFAGTLPGNQGAVLFEIFNQAPPVPEDDDGSGDFTLVSQTASGLGNAGEGDKYHFLWTTEFVSNGATAQGHGFLFVLPSSATFVIAGHGSHPLGGSFNLSGEGDVACFAGEGMAADAMFHLRFASGMEDDGGVVLARCDVPNELCPGEGD
jgi:hypothetical protein